MQVSFRTERECVLIGLKDLKGRVKKDASVNLVDLDSFCEESDEIVNKIREVSLKQERISGSFGGKSINSEHKAEKEEYKDPCMRSRGRVIDHEWIMNKGY